MFYTNDISGNGASIKTITIDFGNFNDQVDMKFMFKIQNSDGINMNVSFPMLQKVGNC